MRTSPPLRARISSRPVRAVCFDVENRPAAYWYDDKTSAEITAFGWKWLDETEARTLILLRTGRFLTDDGATLTAGAAYLRFRGVLEQAGLVYGHNIRRHDLPLVQAGLLRLQLPPLPELLTADTCRDLPRRKDMSVSLENLAALYGLPGEKLRLAQVEWEEANRLTKPGVDLARRRVSSDVVLQEALYLRLRQLGLLRPPRRWVP